MSKKRSNNSTTPPEATPVIYLDESIQRAIADELRGYSVWRVEVHRDHFPHRADGQDESIPDTAVLQKCGENGWILITADDKMRLVPEHRRIAAEYSVKAFLFANGNYKGGEYRSALIVGRHKLLKFAQKHRGPFWARICMTGDCYHLDEQRKQKLGGRDKTAAKYGAVFNGAGNTNG
jgi:hypothetical protein